MLKSMATPTTRVLVAESSLAENGVPRLIGLMPFCDQRFYKLPIRCAAAWRPDEAFDSTPLLCADVAAAAFDAILSGLSGLGYRMLSFQTLSASPTLTQLLESTTDSRGLSVFQRSRFERAALLLEGSADDYLQRSLSKNRRKKTSKALKRLETVGQVAFEKTDANSDFHSWAQDFVDLEASGWKGRQGTAIANRDETLRFFLDAVQRFADKGRVRFGKLSLDDCPVAMLVDFISGDLVSAFKTTFDERYAEHSPGALLEIQNIRWLFESGFRICDSCTAPDNALINSLYVERLGFQDLVISLTPAANLYVRKLLPTIQTLARRIRS